MFLQLCRVELAILTRFQNKEFFKTRPLFHDADIQNNDNKFKCQLLISEFSRNCVGIPRDSWPFLGIFRHC